MHKKALLLIIICSFLILIICSCSNRTTVIKNENESVAAGGISAETLALENTIKEKPTLYQQLQAAFHELDNQDISDRKSEFDSVEFLDFTMKLFKDFLSSEQAYATSESDYNKLSDLINVFPLEKGRIFTYCGTSLLFGDSGKTDFAYLQTKADGKINVSALYENSFKDILNVVQPGKDKNLIILTGRSRGGKPWKAFADGFYIKDGIAGKTSILEDYNDDFWCVDSGEGTIFLVHSLSAETYINKAPGKTLEVEAGEAKLTLSFDNKSLKYAVQPETIQR